MNTSQTWQDKENFHSKYTVVEDISDFLVEKIDYQQLHKNNLEIKTEWETCPICKGFGTIPDISTTAGSNICPHCNGGKQIMKITQIEKK